MLPLRSGLLVGILTFFSKISGLARELFIASVFGSSATADSVNIAFKLPNLFRRIFGEGALSYTFIPIFNSKYLQSKKEGENFASSIFMLLIVLLTLISIVMQLIMPKLLLLLAPGFSAIPQKLETTIFLCRITTPYLIFISAAALLGGILNSMGKFLAFSFSPIILNIVIIFATPLISKSISTDVALCFSILLGGILQLLTLYACVKASNIKLSIKPNFQDTDLKKFFQNLGPSVLNAGILQINLFISQSIASFVPGAVSILSYAERIYQFPLSIIGISFSTVLLPQLSKLYKQKKYDESRILHNNSIKLGLFFSLPAAFGMAILSMEIAEIVYYRGAFTMEDTFKTAETIGAFSLGLPAFILSKILTPTFYARQDTVTPMKITLYSLVINTFLNIFLMFKFRHLGIALGTSIASWCNVFMLLNFLQKLHDYRLTRELFLFTIKTLIAGTIMIVSILLINPFLSGPQTLIKIAFLLLKILTGIIIYAVSSYFLGILDMNLIRKLYSKKKLHKNH